MPLLFWIADAKLHVFSHPAKFFHMFFVGAAKQTTSNRLNMNSLVRIQPRRGCTWLAPGKEGSPSLRGRGMEVGPDATWGSGR